MKNFDYSNLAGRSWDSEIIGLVAQGMLQKHGSGRSTFYTRSDAQ